jgi:uncharacterized protein YfaS (alpha-2-macroglobulin family)
MRATRVSCIVLLLSIASLCATRVHGAEPTATEAPRVARVERFSPLGTAKSVRRATATFSVPMVPLGDPTRARDPFTITCPVAGSGRWVDGRTWVYAFDRDLPAGLRCGFRLRDDVRTLDGATLTGPGEFAFTTGGPQVQSILPDSETAVEEEQRFVLTLDAEPTEASVRAHASFVVDGIVERIPAEVVGGEERDAALHALHEQLGQDAPRVVLRATRPFPSDHRVRLVWGAGVAATSGIATEKDQTFEFRSRRAFTATFDCERESRRAGCIPLTPMTLAFSAPIAWERAKDIALVAGDTRRAPEPPQDGEPFVSRLTFHGPFAESTAYRLELPPGLVDDAGRTLLNAGTFPLAVRTDRMPALAKFAARFGIVETAGGPVLPVTVRNIEATIAGRLHAVAAPAPAASPSVAGAIARVDGGNAAEMLQWLRRVGAAGRSRSVFANGTRVATKPLSLPKPGGAAELKVLGIPLGGPGLYVVELESAALGDALLEKPAPVYVPTAVLATNLAVLLKLAPESSLVWVTALDTAKPVGGARVSIHDCNGTTLWSGVTDADGVARPGRLPGSDAAPTCHSPEDARDAYFDNAQTTALGSLDYGLLAVARTDDDMSFVHSSWERGIEPYRFELPETRAGGPFNAHAILDRTLLRAGDTVHMKHVFRRQTLAGFGLAAAEDAPTTVSIRHVGSDQRIEQPLAWDAAGIAETTWTIPPTAKLGRYEVVLTRPPAHEGEWHREWTAGSFRVEEFRVPLMRATFQAPAAPLVAPTEVPIDVTLRYLAGGGAGNAPVTLRAVAADRTFPAPDDFEGFTFANGGVHEGIVRGDDEEEESDRSVPFQRQQLTLDGTGGARATITTVPQRPTPFDLRAELEFRDPNGEVQTRALGVPVWPARWLAGVKVEDWTRTRGTLVGQIAVVDPSGAPVTGATVSADLFAVRRYGDRKRVVGGFYAYESVSDTRRLGPFCRGTTDAHGRLRCEAKTDASGEVVVQATVTDPEGRASTAHADAYVVDREQLVFAVGDTDRMDVVPERRRYEPGETARFQVRMPFRSATALVSVEREGILDTRVVHLEGDDPVIELPVGESWAPNMFVSVLAVRGRVGDPPPTALVDLAKPAFRIGIAEVQVGWRTHRLTVRVAAERPAYKVRDKAQVKIAVRDADGAPPPAGAEVALAAVDEGLLELQPNASWKLLDAMMGRRGYDVRTSTAQTQVVGKRHFGRKAVPNGGGGGRQPTRELFDTLLLWRSRVPLDAHGRAAVEVPLSDALTSFRIVAVATSGLDRFGTGATSIRTTQDLMLLPGVPPLVRSGDAFPAEVTVRNTTAAPLPVTLRGTVEGLPDPLPPQTATLAAGESRVVSWPVTVPAGVEQLAYAIEASGGHAADRVTVKQTVRPAVPPQTLDARLLHVGDDTGAPLAWPAGAVAGSGEVRVGLAPRLTAGLDGVRETMRQYPYECLEQQVSRAVTLHDDARWQAITASLPAYLDGDGLLKFFPNTDHGSDALTAYVLAVAEAAGRTIPDAVRSKMIDGLHAFLAGTTSSRERVRAADLVLRKVAALDALARVGVVDPAPLGSISVEPSLWPTSAVIDWWSLLGRLPANPARAAQRREAEQVLRTRLSLEGTTMRFTTEDRDRLSWLMICPDVNAVRLVHEAATRGEWTDELPRMVRGALARQQRGAWECTVANAWGTLALDAFADRFERDVVDGTTSVTLGPASARLAWDSHPGGDVLILPWSVDAPLVLTHQGGGSPWVTLQARAALPIAEPRSHGLRITRTVRRVGDATAGATPVTGDTLHVGDLVAVRLEIEVEADTPWAVVSDPLPGGGSHVGGGAAPAESTPHAADAAAGNGDAIDEGETDATAPLFVERAQEAFRAYFDLLPKGRTVVEHTLRVNQQGRFLLPPTRVEAMYAPEIYGEAPNPPVVVEP